MINLLKSVGVLDRVTQLWHSRHAELIDRSKTELHGCVLLDELDGDKAAAMASKGTTVDSVGAQRSWSLNKRSA